MSTSSEASDPSSGKDAGNLKWEDSLDWLHSLHGTKLPELASLPSEEFTESENESLHSGSDNLNSEFNTDFLDLDSDADDELSGSDYYGSSEDDDRDSSRLGLREPINSDKWARLRKWVFYQLSEMYSQRYISIPCCFFTSCFILKIWNHRYEMPHDGLPRGPSYLQHVLTALKNQRGDHFREQLRLDPTTFDVLVSEIEDHPVFMNQSNNPQISVEEQVTITLFRFGHRLSTGRAGGPWPRPTL